MPSHRRESAAKPLKSADVRRRDRRRSSTHARSVPAPVPVASTPVSQNWPYDQQPVVVGRIGRHHSRLIIATPADLNNIATFMAEYAYPIKGDTGVIPDHTGMLYAKERTVAYLKDRYWNAMKAVMDCATPGNVNGLVLKLERNGKIEGVMAFNIVTENFDDPWSQYETRFHQRQENLWIYPGNGYMCQLRDVIHHPRNGGRPIVNIPFLITDLDPNLLPTLVGAFSKFLKGLVDEFRHCAIVNIYSGNHHEALKPYFDHHLGWPDVGRIKDRAPTMPQNCFPYKLMGKFIGPANPALPQPSFAQCIRWALESARDPTAFGSTRETPVVQ
ncbi:hypothetical protein F5Y10DRAFT_292363 [Nemania abortiva]|nr:hypothetical protein F5Y10DRAFT_292363 [Nemania abortiva]